MSCRQAVLIPIRIGFQIDLEPTDTGFWLDVVADILFVMDIAFNFRTGVISSTGALISDGVSCTIIARIWVAFFQECQQ